MLLAIDAGNSNITVGCINSGEIVCVFRIATEISKTEHDYAASIKSILDFNLNDNYDFTGAVIASVVPPLTGILYRTVKMLTGYDAVVVGAGIKTGLNILLDDPGQLGSDIVAAAVSARVSYKLPVIVVDMGTATKLFVINENSGFAGGAIFPGIGLSMNALSAGTSQLPKVPIEAPKKCISANTIDCMKSGAIFGTASMIDGMAERFEYELGKKASIVATGGHAEAIYRHCKCGIVYDPHLILRGMEILYEKNIKR